MKHRLVKRIPFGRDKVSADMEAAERKATGYYSRVAVVRSMFRSDLTGRKTEDYVLHLYTETGQDPLSYWEAG